MTALSLDTHAPVRKFTATGLSEDQAEAITTAIRESRDADLTNLVTTMDLAGAKFDITKWMIGSIGFRTIVIVGAAVVLSRATHCRARQMATPTRTNPAAAPPPPG